ncbi:MAG: hypothetical protein KBT20_10005 [Bacteroidales bacterium]|nr:hypothetical protein [Candidatus Liminaster caballi]
MKKILFLLMLCGVICSSCTTGRYVSNVSNNFGIQTQVVLDHANYRVVRNIETYAKIDGAFVSKSTVENSAISKLFKENPLVGCQAYINVTVEEANTQTTNIFVRMLGGYPTSTQFVVARATIIEFIDGNGCLSTSIDSNLVANTTASTYTNTNATTVANPVALPVVNEAEPSVVKEEPVTTEVNAEDNQVAVANQTEADPGRIGYLKTQIKKCDDYMYYNSFSKAYKDTYKAYITKVLDNLTEENVDQALKIIDFTINSPHTYKCGKTIDNIRKANLPNEAEQREYILITSANKYANK